MKSSLPLGLSCFYFRRRTALLPLIAAFFLTYSISPLGFSQAPDEVVELEEFEIRGIQELIERGLADQRAALNLRDVIHSDAIGRLPDKNLADALSRVPGVAIIRSKGEGRYVSIRGVQPGLNNVVVDGHTIGATDVRARGGRPPPLELLSAAAIGSLEVHKTVTPDMDGHSIGGTVNMKSHSAFDRDQRTFAFGSASIGTNDRLVNGIGPGGTDIWETAFGWGTRFGADEQWGLFLSGNFSSRDYMAQQLDNRDYRDLGNGVFVGTLKEIETEYGNRERFGLSANLEFRPDADTNLYFRSFFTRLDDNNERITLEKRMRSDFVVVTPTSGRAMGEFQLEGRTMLERRETFQFILGADRQVSPDWHVSASVAASEGREVRDEVVHEFKRRSLPGRFLMHWDNSVPWRPRISVPHPDDERMDMTQDPDLFRQSRIRFEPSNVPERVWTAQADVVRNLDAFGNGGMIKFGAKFTDRDKLVDNKSIRFIPVNGGPADLSLADGFLTWSADRIGPFQGGVYPSHVSIDGAAQLAFFRATGPNGGNFTIDERGFPVAGSNDHWIFQEAASIGNSFEDNYRIGEELWAGYIMADVRPTDRLTLIGGLRVENTKGTFNGHTILDPSGADVGLGALPPGANVFIEPISDTNSFTSWMPNLQARYDVTDDIVARAAATYTIGRPDYIAMRNTNEFEVENELGPSHFADGFLEIGNPDLDPFESTNFDVSISYYPRAGAITLGAFYKRIKNPVYSFRDIRFDETFQGIRVETLNIFSQRNSDPGTIRGLELTVYQHLYFLPAPFDGFGISGNISLMSSSVSAPERPGEEFRFFNQPDKVGNVQLYYERGGFEGRLAYQWQDTQMTSLGGSITTDPFEDKSAFLDLKLSQRITDNWSVFFEAANLTNEEQRTYVIRPGLPFRNPGFEPMGVSYMIGVSWRM